MVPSPKTKTPRFKTKTETKTCKNGSRDQDSSLENSKSGYKQMICPYLWNVWFWTQIKVMVKVKIKFTFVSPKQLLA